MRSSRPPAKPSRRPRRVSRHEIALLLILLLVAALRLWGIGAKSLWLDEIMTVQKASMPFSQMMEQIKQHDAHPPLFQIVEWGWLRLGRGDGFARIPSAAFGVAAVWLAYLIARRLFSKRTGLFAALLMALSYFHIYYSQEARLFSLVTTLFLAQVYVLLRILHQRGKAHWAWWSAYGLLALLSLYTYALCVVTIAALAVVYLLHIWKRPQQRQLKQWIAVHIVVALLFLPWVPVLEATTAKVRAAAKAFGEERGRPGPAELATGFASWAVGPLNWQSSESGGALFGAILLIGGGVGLFMRPTRKAAKVLAILFCVPLLGYLAMPMPRVHEYDPKHLAFLQPILLIALAAFRLPFGGHATHKSARAAVYVVFMLMALNLWTFSTYFSGDFQKERWPDACADVVPRLDREDAIVFNPERIGFAFSHYARSPRGPNWIRQLAEAGAPLTWEYVIRFNQQNPEVELPSLSNRIQRVWVIECANSVSSPSPFAHSKLVRQGFRSVDSAKYSGSLGYVQWVLYQRTGTERKETTP